MALFYTENSNKWQRTGASLSGFYEILYFIKCCISSSQSQTLVLFYEYKQVNTHQNIKNSLLWKSIGTRNCLVTNIFFCVLKKNETNTGLEQ